MAFYENDLLRRLMWVNKWSHHGPGPKKLVDVLSACDGTSLPNIKVLLQLPTVRSRVALEGRAVVAIQVNPNTNLDSGLTS